MKSSIDHIRVWEYKCYSWQNLRSILKHNKHDKYIDSLKTKMFVEYDENIIKYYDIYISKHQTIEKLKTIIFAKNESKKDLDLNLDKQTSNISQIRKNKEKSLKTIVEDSKSFVLFRTKSKFFLIIIIFFYNSYSIWYHILIHARFYNLQKRLRLDVFFLSLNNFLFNLEFFFQREFYALRATHFFFFNFEIVTILNYFNNAMSIIIRIVDVISFRVFRILIIFVILIILLHRNCKFRQFEHVNSTCRIVMTSWS